MKSKILLSVLLLVVIVAGTVLLTQKVFRVHAVVVQGCVERSPQEVTTLSSIVFDESIFKVELNDVQAGIETSPYFKVEKIRRVYPDKISIQIHERRPRAILQFLDANIVMDEEGYILEVREELGGIRCPLVTNMKVTTFSVGQMIASEDPAQLRAMHDVLVTLIEQDASQLISEIMLQDILDIKMMTIDGYTVMLGDTNELPYKISVLLSILPKLKELSYYGGTIYLSEHKGGSYLPADENGQAIPLAEGAWPENTQEQETLMPEETAVP